MPLSSVPGCRGAARIRGMTNPNEWLTITALDLDARGIARNEEGVVVFVEGGLPPEQVQVEVTRRKPQWEQARAVRRRRDSDLRVQPRCPHFGTCGGCAMQHLHVPGQVAIKQRVLEDNLWHLAKVRPASLLRPIHGPAWGYRGRARLSVRHVPRKGGVLVGFREKRSSYVADMRTCPVLPPRISALLLPLRELIAGLAVRDAVPQIELAQGDDTTVLVLRHLQPVGDADRERLRAFGHRHGVQWWLQPKGPETAHPLDPHEGQPLAYALEEFGVHMPFLPTDFTQVNQDINRVMVHRAVRLLAPGPQDRVIDWFCGLGNFTLPIARHAATVLGLEGSAPLVHRAQANARLNGLDQRAQFEVRNLFEMDAPGIAALGPATLWLLDPPREGAFALAKGLADLHQDPALAPGFVPPRRIVYVSCNPATLARDAGLLVHQAGYRCAQAGIVNMFPHTSHVESMAVFDRD